MDDRCVIDASALVTILIGKTDRADAARDHAVKTTMHAPHLIDVEVGNVLRRHESRHLITSHEAFTALGCSDVLVHHRYPHTRALCEFAWTLRHNLSFYDAMYVALAHNLGVPLITADARLANTPNLPCAADLI